MVIIEFREGVDWYKANWVFRQLAADVVASYPEDERLKSVMEQAQSVGGLLLDSMEPHAAAAILQEIERVAELTVSGTIPGWRQTNPCDEEGQKMYVTSISELLELIRNESARFRQR